MRNIFLFIYSCMLVAIIVVAIGLYLSYEKIHKHRLNNYLDGVASGTFTLIAQGLARHEDQKREEWFALVRKLTGLNLTLSHKLPATLSKSDLDAINNYRTVIAPSLDSAIASLAIKVANDQPLYLSADLFDINEQLARVTALLILNELGRHPIQERSAKVEQLSTLFSFPINVVSKDAATLDFTQARRVDRGDIVVALKDASASEPYFEVFAKYGNSGLLFKMGPVPIFNAFPAQLILTLGLIGLTVLAMSCFLIVKPLEKRLQKMERTVEKIGTDLIPAMPISGDDAISRLGEKVNNMALRIQGLLDEQKELSHAVSHELRTPVARMKFRLASLHDLILESGDQNEQYLKRDISTLTQLKDGIENDLAELDHLINELLTLARLEESSKEQELDNIDMSGMLNRVVENTIQYSQGLGTPLEIQPPAKDVKAVEYLIERAVQNLVSNASRYAQSVIQISFVQRDGFNVITVDDDGPGIPEHDRVRIFDPFIRLDKSRNRESGGYGLGLSIVQRIAKFHQGQVSIESNHWNGTKFILSWPLTLV